MSENYHTEIINYSKYATNSRCLETLVETLECLSQNYYSFSYFTNKYDALNGDLNIIKWLRKNYYPWDDYIFSMAIDNLNINGKLELLDWIRKNGCPEILINSSCAACKDGEYDDIIFDYELLYDNKINSYFKEFITFSFDLELNSKFQLLEELLFHMNNKINKDDYNDVLIFIEKYYGHLHIFKFIKKYKLVFNFHSFLSILNNYKEYDFDFLIWICKDGYCPEYPTKYIDNNIKLIISNHEIDSKIDRYNFNIKKILEDKLNPLNVYFIRDICISAIKERRIDILEFIHENFSLWIDKKMCIQAAINGDLNILKWLREHNIPWDHNVCKFAFNNKHHDVLFWAFENDCPVEINKISSNNINLNIC